MACICSQPHSVHHTSHLSRQRGVCPLTTHRAANRRTKLCSSVGRTAFRWASPAGFVQYMCASQPCKATHQRSTAGGYPPEAECIFIRPCCCLSSCWQLRDTASGKDLDHPAGTLLCRCSVLQQVSQNSFLLRPTGTGFQEQQHHTRSICVHYVVK